MGDSAHINWPIMSKKAKDEITTIAKVPSGLCLATERLIVWQPNVHRLATTPEVGSQNPIGPGRFNKQVSYGGYLQRHLGM